MYSIALATTTQVASLYSCVYTIINNTQGISVDMYRVYTLVFGKDRAAGVSPFMGGFSRGGLYVHMYVRT